MNMHRIYAWNNENLITNYYARLNWYDGWCVKHRFSLANYHYSIVLTRWRDRERKRQSKHWLTSCAHVTQPNATVTTTFTDIPNFPTSFTEVILSATIHSVKLPQKSLYIVNNLVLPNILSHPCHKWTSTHTQIKQKVPTFSFERKMFSMILALLIFPTFTC